MSEILLLFWDQLLKNNTVLISFTAVLFIIVETPKLRAAFKDGMVITAAMAFSALSAWIFSYYLVAFGFLLPAVYFLNSLIAIELMKNKNLLQGKWTAGIKHEFIALPALLSLQFNIVERVSYNYQDPVILIASLTAVYIIFIIIAAIKEQLKLNESKNIFQTEYILFLVFAFLSAVMSGYNFL